VNKNQIPQKWEPGIVINIHKHSQKVNAKITEELFYCLKPTNYSKTLFRHFSRFQENLTS
jgi:hypothetical protein